MTLELLQQLAFSKDKGQLPQITSPSDPLQQAIYFTVIARDQIGNALGKKQRAGWILERKLRYLQELRGCKAGEEVVRLLEVSMEHFVFEINNVAEADPSQEKQLNKLVENTVESAHFHSAAFWNSIKGSLLLATTYLELHLKALLIRKKLRPLEEINALEKRARETASSFSVALLFCRKVVTVVSHLKVYCLNAGVRQADRIVELLRVLIVDCSSETKVATLDCRITLLYNCLKVMLAAKCFSPQQEEALGGFYEAFGVKPVRTYQEHLLYVFFIIKGFIFRKGQAMQGIGGDEEEDEKSSEGQREALAERLSTWVSINMEEVCLAVQEVTRNIIRHRVASVATLMGMKLGLPQFTLNFLELMHDGPFNNDAQTIKLCFELFEARQYQKLHNCLQVLLSAASCQRLREREVLLSMCAIFTGLFLENREEALLYAKLNHSQNKRAVLREETLWQQVGFAYYNLAIHGVYACNRQAFLTQALTALLNSIRLNPGNYLAQYCAAKVYLMQCDYESAYKHAVECCKSGRGEWMPFCLLACVYFCQRRVSKASLIIEELTKKYCFNKMLHYVSAYLEANRILLEVEYDQEVEAAKQLGEEIYDLCREKIIKSKSMATLLTHCQLYHQLSVGLVATDYDENYFNLLIASPDNNFMESFREGLGYQQGSGEQALLHIIPLLLQVGLFTLSEGLLKILPQSTLRSYNRAALYQLRKEPLQAAEEYRSILKQQPYHTQTLISLALTEPDPSEGLHYIDIAEKFVSNGRVWAAKGVLLSRLGRTGEATGLLLKEGEQGWLELQPDLLYYY